MQIDINKEEFLLEFMKNIPFEGCNSNCMEFSAKNLGKEIDFGYIIFPGGEKEVIEFYSDYIDEKIKRTIIDNPIEGRVHEKIINLVMLRLSFYDVHKESIKKIISFSLRPQNITNSPKMLWRTADSFWHFIGDSSTDFNYYTKRLLLSCVYSKTLIYWLSDDSANYENTRSFLEGAINDVLLIGKIKSSTKQVCAKIKNVPFLRLAFRKFKF